MDKFRLTVDCKLGWKAQNAAENVRKDSRYLVYMTGSSGQEVTVYRYDGQSIRGCERTELKRLIKKST